MRAHELQGVPYPRLGLAALTDKLDDAMVDTLGDLRSRVMIGIPWPALEPVGDYLLGTKSGGQAALLFGKRDAGGGEDLYLGPAPERLGIDQQAVEVEDRRKKTTSFQFRSFRSRSAAATPWRNPG